MTSIIDYMELNNGFIDSELAGILGWYLDLGRLDGIPCYVSADCEDIMPVEDWSPSTNVAQAISCIREKFPTNNLNINTSTIDNKRCYTVSLSIPGMESKFFRGENLSACICIVFFILISEELLKQNKG